MSRLAGCLDAIGRTQRTVLVLRAGVGSRSPHTRLQVSRRLNVSVRRVARTERRGLRRLRGSAAAGNCGGGNHGAGTTGAGATGASGTPPTTPVAAGDTAQSGGRGDAGPGLSGVQDEFRTGGPGPSGGSDRDPLLPPAGDATEQPIVMLLSLAFLLGFLAIWALERRRLNPSRRGPPAPRRS